MSKPLLTLTASAFLLVSTVGLAQAHSTDEETMQPAQGMTNGQQGRSMMKKGQAGMMGHGGGMVGRGMMGHGGVMGHGRGMMGRGMMGHGGMMQVVFAIMDANGDGALSLEEFQEAHARIFAHMDVDADGQVTKEEIQNFFHGGKDDTDVSVDDLDNADQ